jgi:hypothetical protein
MRMTSSNWARSVRLPLARPVLVKTVLLTGVQQGLITPDNDVDRPISVTGADSNTSAAWKCSSNQVADGNNTMCSVDSTDSTENRYQCSSMPSTGGYNCSTGPSNTNDGGAGPTQCSAQGGASANNGNGSNVCSTLATDCSVYGDTAGAMCSTLTGQHLACSVGDGGTATCSTQNGAKAGNNYCSVSSDTTGNFGNKCSSILTVNQPNNDQGTSLRCSSFQVAGANNSTNFCSVIIGANPTNAGCTVLVAQGQSTQQGSYQCSAFGNAPQNTCSAMIGGVFTGPANNRCGSVPIKGHENY